MKGGERRKKGARSPYGCQKKVNGESGEVVMNVEEEDPAEEEAPVASAANLIGAGSLFPAMTLLRSASLVSKASFRAFISVSFSHSSKLIVSLFSFKETSWLSRASTRLDSSSFLASEASRDSS